MDPNENLEEQRKLSAQILARIDKGQRPATTDVMKLAELVQALDEWIAKGGALPDAWKQEPLTLAKQVEINNRLRDEGK